MVEIQGNILQDLVEKWVITVSLEAAAAISCECLLGQQISSGVYRAPSLHYFLLFFQQSCKLTYTKCVTLGKSLSFFKGFILELFPVLKWYLIIQFSNKVVFMLCKRLFIQEASMKNPKMWRHGTRPEKKTFISFEWVVLQYLLK